MIGRIGYIYVWKRSTKLSLYFYFYICLEEPMQMFEMCWMISDNCEIQCCSQFSLFYSIVSLKNTIECLLDVESDMSDLYLSQGKWITASFIKFWGQCHHNCASSHSIVSFSFTINYAQFYLYKTIKYTLLGCTQKSIGTKSAPDMMVKSTPGR